MNNLGEWFYDRGLLVKLLVSLIKIMLGNRAALKKRILAKKVLNKRVAKSTSFCVELGPVSSSTCHYFDHLCLSKGRVPQKNLFGRIYGQKSIIQLDSDLDHRRSKIRGMIEGLLQPQLYTSILFTNRRLNSKISFLFFLQLLQISMMAPIKSTTMCWYMAQHVSCQNMIVEVAFVACNTSGDKSPRVSFYM